MDFIFNVIESVFSNTVSVSKNPVSFSNSTSVPSEVITENNVG